MNWWPFMFKSTYQSLLNEFIYILQDYRAMILRYQDQMRDKNQEIEQLKALLTSQSVIITPKVTPESPKSLDFPHPGRSGWRARAESASQASIPPPSDSAQALEARVIREGGKI